MPVSICLEKDRGAELNGINVDSSVISARAEFVDIGAGFFQADAVCSNGDMNTSKNFFSYY